MSQDPFASIFGPTGSGGYKRNRNEASSSSAPAIQERAPPKRQMNFLEQLMLSQATRKLHGKHEEVVVESVRKAPAISAPSEEPFKRNIVYPINNDPSPFLSVNRRPTKEMQEEAQQFQDELLHRISLQQQRSNDTSLDQPKWQTSVSLQRLMHKYGDEPVVVPEKLLAPKPKTAVVVTKRVVQAANKQTPVKQQQQQPVEKDVAQQPSVVKQQQPIIAKEIVKQQVLVEHNNKKHEEDSNPVFAQMMENQKRLEEKQTRPVEQTQQHVGQRSEQNAQQQMVKSKMEREKAEQLRKQFAQQKDQEQREQENRLNDEIERRAEAKDNRLLKWQQQTSKLVQHSISRDLMDQFKNANSIFQQQQFDKAMQAYAEIIKQAPYHGRVYLYRAIASMNAGKYQEAIKDWTNCIELVEFDDLELENAIKAFQLRGKCYKQTKQFTEAIDDFSRVLEFGSEKDLAVIYMDRAVCYDFIGQILQAIEDYNQFFQCALNPHSTSQKPTTLQFFQAHYNRGLAYSKLNEHEKAINDFESASEVGQILLSQQGDKDNLKQTLVDCLFQKACSNECLGQDKEAIANYKQLLKLDSSHIKSLLQLAHLYYSEEQYEFAIQFYALIVEKLDPNDVSALFNMGMCQRMLGDLESAIETFKKVQNKQPSHYRSYVQCAKCMKLHSQQKPDLKDNRQYSLDIIEQLAYAIQVVQSLMKKQSIPSDEENNMLLSTLFFDRGLLCANLAFITNAASDFTEAIKLDPYFIAAYFNRGVCNFHDLKNYDAASNDFNSVLQYTQDSDVEALLERGMLFFTVNKMQEAMEDWKRALVLDPTNQMAKDYLHYCKQ